jgi:hypothetical protein
LCLIIERKHVVETINGNILILKDAIIKTINFRRRLCKGNYEEKLLNVSNNNDYIVKKEVALIPFEPAKRLDEILLRMYYWYTTSY